MLLTREATESDYPLIADSFYRIARKIPSNYGTGRPLLMAMLDKVIADPEWSVVVLYETDVPDETIGWAIHRGADELFFIAVKPRFQRLGMAKHILERIGLKPGVIKAPFVPPKLVAVAGRSGYQIALRPYLAL